MNGELYTPKVAKALSTLPPVSHQSYLFLRNWIHRESGIVIDQEKIYLLQVRLAPIVEQHKLGSMETLCNKLKDCAPGIGRQVVEAMTTNETLFFRDTTPFDALRKHILPKLLAEKKKGEKLILWSAAASTGQEAYSLAITLLEMGLNSVDADIFGSDLSDDVLTKARVGIYSKFEVNRGLPNDLLNRYFNEVSGGWQVKEHVRKMVRFRQLDLRSPLRGYGPFHVILCRNVLIYFDQPSKANILLEMSHTLVRGGYLMLGAAETVSSEVPGLQRTPVGNGIAYLST